MGTSVFLRDHKPGASGWHRVLHSAFEGLIAGCSDDAFDCCIFEELGFESAAIIFLHTQSYQHQWLTAVERGDIDADLVLVRSEGGHSGYRGSCQRIHECIWSPDEFLSRPEPQQFAADILNHAEPRWDLLNQAQFPAALLACSWLLASGNQDAIHEKTLAGLWTEASAEAIRLALGKQILPNILPPTSHRHELKNIISTLLDTTWHGWAPFSPVVASRRRLSHEWCAKRAMHKNAYTTAGAYLDDLRFLTDGMQEGFLPSQYYPLLQSCLDTLPPPAIRGLLQQIDTIVNRQFRLSSLHSELSGYLNMLEELLKPGKRALKSLDRLTDDICNCLEFLPKEVPQP
jgi:hypothetical protein